MSRIQLFALMLLAALGAGCNRSAAPEVTTSTSSDSADTETQVSTEAGTLQMKSGSDLSLPADFPKDVYVPGFKSLENIMHLGPTTSLVMSLDKPSSTLMADIESKMKAQGWQTTMSMVTGGQANSMLAFSKPERSAMYTLALTDGHGQLTLQHTQSPQ